MNAYMFGICVLTALVGCGSKDIESQHSIHVKKHISELTYDSDYIADFNEPVGNYLSVTPQEDALISQGNAAVPFLIDALNVGTKPKTLGGVAFCLRRIGSKDGGIPARRVLERLNDRLSWLSADERFAYKRLYQYIFFIDNVSTNVPSR